MLFYACPVPLVYVGRFDGGAKPTNVARPTRRRRDSADGAQARSPAQPRLPWAAICFAPPQLRRSRLSGIGGPTGQSARRALKVELADRALGAHHAVVACACRDAVVTPDASHPPAHRPASSNVTPPYRTVRRYPSAPAPCVRACVRAWQAQLGELLPALAARRASRAREEQRRLGDEGRVRFAADQSHEANRKPPLPPAFAQGCGTARPRCNTAPRGKAYVLAPRAASSPLLILSVGAAAELAEESSA